MRRSCALLTLLLTATTGAAQPAPSTPPQDPSPPASTAAPDPATLFHQGFVERDPSARTAYLAVTPPPLAGDDLLTLAHILRDAPADDPILSDALRALATTPHILAIQAVADLTQRQGLPTAARDLAFATLEALTARRDPSRDINAWREWIADLAALPPQVLQTQLAHRQAARAAAARQRNAALAAQLSTAYSRLYLLTPEANRGELLTELIASDELVLATLGFDLAIREILSAKPLPPSVPQSAANRLADPSPDFRAIAAQFLERVDATAAMDQVLAALAVETDERAAAALLRTTARHPIPAAKPLVLERLKRNSPAQPAAVEAALALHRAHPFTSPRELLLIRGSVVSMLPDRITAPGVALLVELGDTETAIALLTDEREALQIAAATALAQVPTALDPLLEAAASNVRIADSALDALIRFRPTAQGYAQATALPALSEERRTRRLLELGKALPTPELTATAVTLEDPTARERLLAILTTPERLTPLQNTPDATVGPDANATLEGLTNLVATRIELGRPDAALQALLLIPPALRTPDHTADHITLLVWLGRTTQADELTRTADLPEPDATTAWAKGLSRCATLEHAPATLTTLRILLAQGLLTEDALTDADRETISNIELTLAPTGGSGGDSPSAVPNPSPTDQPTPGDTTTPSSY